MKNMWVGLLMLTACSGGPAPESVGEVARESIEVVRDCAEIDEPVREEPHIALDVTYATVDGRALRLDLAWPRASGRHPLVVLIHGGGWSGGHRAEYRPEMRFLASRGYAAASLEYRLADAPLNVFPAAVEDVRCAVRWLRANAAVYGIDPERIAALGSSAGGHLAAMLGTAADVPGLDGACPLVDGSPEVHAVVSLAAPLDIRTAAVLNPSQRSMVENFLGVAPEEDPERALLASPAVHASAGAPPFLLIHGTADPVVPVRQSRSMRDSLREAGVPATLIELPGVGHSFPELSGQPPFRVSSCTTLSFLRERLRPGER